MPWFIDWNAYRSTFEREAEKILGQPVHVAGTADVSLLPMPSLTFTDVRVGDGGGQPMMRVDRFSLHVELFPLLTGSFKVVDMTIERPQVEVTIDADGSIDWLQRSEASKALDPDQVSLQRVDIMHGSLSYLDSRTGRVVQVDDVNATLDARSLLGPWKVEGGAVVEGTPTTFRLATGRRNDDGSIRVKLEANPASAPLALSAEGDLSLDAKGLIWNGGFSLVRVAGGDNGDAAQGGGWRALGKFELRPSMLRLPELALAAGPEDRPYGVTGAASVDLGADMRFDAVLKSRQLDLDRAIGKGPNQPATVDQAASVLVTALGQLPTPAIPGKIGFDIPGVIIGGSVVQNLRFDALTAAGGWKIEEFVAELPGRTRLTGDGIVRTAPVPSFTGGVRFVSNQPSIFASWWRGAAGANQRPLQAFDMSGQLTLSPVTLDISNMSARLGGSILRGRLNWQRDGGGRRSLSLDVKADRFDYDQIAALTAILAGHSPSEPGGIADDITAKIAAGTLLAFDTSFADVSLDGGYSSGVINLNKLSIGNVAGAAVTLNGKVRDLATTPSGSLSATLKAQALGGLADLALRLAPDAAVSHWLSRASADLGPLDLVLAVNGQAIDQVTNANLRLNGSAAGTAIDLALGWSGRPAQWRDGDITASARITNDDTAQVLRQIGYATLPGLKADGFELKMTPGEKRSLAEGVPAQFAGSFAGLAYAFNGSLALDASLLPVAKGKIDVEGSDLTPALAVLAGAPPDGATPRPLKMAADVGVSGRATQLAFRDATIGSAIASGQVELAPVAGRWRLGGSVDVDEADLAMPVGLGLGLGDQGDDAGGPWSKASFGPPAIDGFDVDLTLDADRLLIGDGLSVGNAVLNAKLSGGRTELGLEKGDLDGGVAAGSLSIQNTGGDATVAAQFSVKGANLAELAWQRDGRSVADGKLDVSGQIQGSGRTLAGVVSSLSGNGSMHIGAGTARFVNPDAFSQVMRIADAGRDLGEAELKKLFAGYLDAGTLAFERIEGAFTVTAGAVRAQNVEVQTKGANIVGGVTVDLNDGTLNSQWTLAVDPDGTTAGGLAPQVGLVFRGPFEAPERVVDVSPLVGYLQIRASERENERIQKLEAEIREKEKLDRMMRFFRDDAARRAEADKRAAAAAAKAEADRQAAEAAAKAEADRKAAEAAAKAEADRKAAEAAAKADADRKAAAAAEAAKKAAEAKAIADQAAADAAKAAEEAKRAAEKSGQGGAFQGTPDMLQLNPN